MIVKIARSSKILILLIAFFCLIGVNIDNQAHALQGADLVLSEIEVTQSIQDLKNSVGLIARKPTTVRLYPLNNGTGTVTRVQGYVSGTLNGQALAEIRCFNTVTAEPLSNPRLYNARQDAVRTPICQLPATWFRSPGTLVITGRIESSQINESSAQLQNNRKSVSVTIAPSLTLKVELVPIRTNCTNNCAKVNGPSDAEMFRALQFVRTMYPASHIEAFISKGWLKWDPKMRDADIHNSLYRNYLLAQTKGEKVPERVSDVIRLGIIPNDVYEPRFGNGWCDGYLKVGYVYVVPGSYSETSAHELGHCVGMDHVNDGQAAGPPFENYPYDPQRLSAAGERDHFGFDISIGSKDPRTHKDIMAYGYISGLGATPRWTSDYTYRKIYCLIENIKLDEKERLKKCEGFSEISLEPPGEVIFGGAGRYILVTGLIDLETRALLSFDTLPLPERFIPTDHFAIPVNPYDFDGEIFIEILDRSGSSIFTAIFNLLESHVDSDVGEPFHQDVGSISMILPYVEEGAGISLFDSVSGRTLYSKVGEGFAPEVALGSVRTFFDGDVVTLNWDVFGVREDALLATILLSDDGGETWEPVAIGIDATAGFAELDAASWAESDNAILSLLITDGTATTTLYSDRFSIPNRPPRLVLEEPLDDSLFTSEQPIVFRAYAFDAEDGVVEDDSINWYSGIDGFLGNGAQLVLDDLTFGVHEITAVAFDSEGQMRQQSVFIEIVVGE